MMEEAIKKLLAGQNGGAGMTVEEIAEALSVPVPVVRQDLAALVFVRKEATAATTVVPGKGGKKCYPARYRLGDPTSLVKVRA